jgi:hypothetical protein
MMLVCSQAECHPQRAQQPLAVDRIRLGAPVASGHGNFRFPPDPEVRSMP